MEITECSCFSKILLRKCNTYIDLFIFFKSKLDSDLWFGLTLATLNKLKCEPVATASLIEIDQVRKITSANFLMKKEGTSSFCAPLELKEKSMLWASQHQKLRKQKNCFYIGCWVVSLAKNIGIQILPSIKVMLFEFRS